MRLKVREIWTAKSAGRAKGSVMIFQSACWTGPGYTDPQSERNTIFLGGVWNNSDWEKTPGALCEGWETALLQAAARLAELSLQVAPTTFFFADALITIGANDQFHDQFDHSGVVITIGRK